MVRLPSVIFIVVYSVINIKESSLAVSVPQQSKFSHVEVKTNQDDDGSSSLDIHLAVEFGSTSLNLRSTMSGDEINLVTKDLNSSKVVNQEEKSPVVARSTSITDVEKNTLEPKLDSLVTKLQNTERTLDDIQSTISVNFDPEKTCLIEEKSLGVHYSSCTKLKVNTTHYPKNCREVQQNGQNVTGLYKIYPTHSDTPFLVLCDMETKGGGWTHIQKRFDGSQDFFLGWRDYKFGFGNLDGEFWLGLQKTYLLAGFDPTELLVEIVDRDNVSAYAHYSSFAIGSEPGGYKLDRLSGFSGDAGDSLIQHLGSKFSTKDLDFTDGCAGKYLGGWWYKACHVSNINGKYINVDLPKKYEFQGLHWLTFRSHQYCHSKSRMLVRPSH